MGEKKLSSKDLFEMIVMRLLLNLYPAIEQMPSPSFRWLEKTPNHAKWVPDHQRFVYRNLQYAKRWARCIEEQTNHSDLAIMGDRIYFAPLFKTLVKKKSP